MRRAYYVCVRPRKRMRNFRERQSKMLFLPKIELFGECFTCLAKLIQPSVDVSSSVRTFFHRQIQLSVDACLIKCLDFGRVFHHVADLILTYIYLCAFFIVMYHISTSIWVFLNLRSTCISVMQLSPFLGAWEVYKKCTGELFIFPLDKFHFVLLTFPLYFISLFYALQISSSDVETFVDLEVFVYVAFLFSLLSFARAIYRLDSNGILPHAKCANILMWLFRFSELAFKSAQYVFLAWISDSDYVIAWVVVQIVFIAGMKLSCPEEAQLSPLARLNIALFHVVCIDLDYHLWMSWLTNLLKLLDVGVCGAAWYFEEMPEPPFTLLATLAVSLTLCVVLIPFLFCNDSFQYMKYREGRERRQFSTRGRSRSNSSRRRGSSFQAGTSFSRNDSDSPSRSSPKRRKPENMKTTFRSPRVNDKHRSAEELAKQGRSPSEILRRGFSIASLRDAGFSAVELKRCGVPLHELFEGGYSAYQLKLAGFQVEAHLLSLGDTVQSDLEDPVTIEDTDFSNTIEYVEEILE